MPVRGAHRWPGGDRIPRRGRGHPGGPERHARPRAARAGPGAMTVTAVPRRSEADPVSPARPAAPRREVVSFRAAFALILLAVADDAFVHPEPGTGPADHLAGGLIPLAIGV